MGMFDIFRRRSQPEAQSRPLAATGTLFTGLDDPDLLEFMRGGSETAAGTYVTASKSLQNMALLRCVTLISESIGKLPLNLHEAGDDMALAKSHPLYKILKRKPNNWQTAYEFKRLMQLRVLLHGNAYARVIRSRGQIIRLVPIEPAQIEPIQTDDWNVVYRYTRKDGGTIDYPVSDIFHIQDISEDGLKGLSRVKLAREALGIALQAEKAAAKLFKNGVMAGGALSSPNALSDPAFKRLQDSLNEKAGADQAHKWMILEEGLTAAKFADTAADSQHIENRNHQIEEIARAMGVPRPLLMMDDTSWGSGIEQLAMFFVEYALDPWFKAWEQAIERSLIDDADSDRVYPKFNEKALLRSSVKDQAEFFTKALGAGGHSPWMKVNEVRKLQELPKSDEPSAESLESPLMRNNRNESAKTA